MGFLIFEGCDLTGKTTLIENICENYNVDVLAKYKLSNYDWKNHISIIGKIMYKTLANFQKYDFIVDRLAISDFVYDKVYQRNNDKSFINLRKDFRDSKIVYVTVSDFSIIEKRKNERPEINITYDKLNALYKEYELFFTSFSDVPVLKIINDDENSINNNVKEIINFWKLK